jgi:hypothetical protein
MAAQIDPARLEPELGRWEEAQRARASAQLAWFRAARELCETVRKLGVPGVTEVEGETVTLHPDGKVEITYLDATYTLDQLPGLIEALERAVKSAGGA